MNIYSKKQKWKYALFIIAIIMSGMSIYLTKSLENSLEESVNSLSQSIKTLKQNEKTLKIEEANNMANFAKAMQVLNNMTIYDEGDYSWASELIQQNTTIPLILIDECDDIIKHKNLGISKNKGSKKEKNYILKELASMKERGDSIFIDVHEQKQRLFYRNSDILEQTSKMHEFTSEKQIFTKEILEDMKWHPYYQIAFILLFILLAYFIFNAARKSEQNQVWAGMAKETAHQIGTPLSSLIAWVELLKENPQNTSMAIELEKDLEKLKTITERFSKIGSKPELNEENIKIIIADYITYMQKRFSKNIKFNQNTSIRQETIKLNKVLIIWVIENICKNAADAMKGKGEISIGLEEEKNHVLINISDTGDGINREIIKNIFKPGVTSKKRGWGLGLSLSKRIVEEYHNGQLFIMHSGKGIGTTFTIRLPRK